MNIFDDYSKKPEAASVATAMVPAAQPAPMVNEYIGGAETIPADTVAKPSFFQQAGNYFAKPETQNMLGNLATSIMGEHKDSWQAQMGGDVSENAVKQKYSEVVSKLLSGEDISKVDTKMLPPELVGQALDMQEKSIKLKGSELRENFKLFQSIMESNSSIEYKNAMTKMLTKQVENMLTKDEELRERAEDRKVGITQAKIGAEASKYNADKDYQVGMASVKVQKEGLIKQFGNDPMAIKAAGVAESMMGTILENSVSSIDISTIGELYTNLYNTTYGSMTGKPITPVKDEEPEKESPRDYLKPKPVRK